MKRTLEKYLHAGKAKWQLTLGTSKLPQQPISNPEQQPKKKASSAKATAVTEKSASSEDVAMITDRKEQDISNSDIWEPDLKWIRFCAQSVCLR